MGQLPKTNTEIEDPSRCVVLKGIDVLDNLIIKFEFIKTFISLCNMVKAWSTYLDCP